MKTESQIRTEGHGYKGQTLFRLSSIAVLAIMPFFYNSYCDHRNVQKKIQYQETVKMPAEIEKICADLDKNPTQQQKAGYRICRDFDSYKVISDDSDLIHPNLCESRETDYKIDDHMEDDNPTIIPRQMLVEREQNCTFKSGVRLTYSTKTQLYFSQNRIDELKKDQNALGSLEDKVLRRK